MSILCFRRLTFRCPTRAYSVGCEGVAAALTPVLIRMEISVLVRIDFGAFAYIPY